MYNRECVSYTAFRVAASGRYVPWGLGNANQWDDNARARGIPVDSNPRPGDVAISNAGAFGHAMYVESVSGGTIFVSQYNAALDGRYSTKTISAAGLVFIHF
jgi:surface antigen